MHLDSSVLDLAPLQGQRILLGPCIADENVRIAADRGLKNDSQISSTSALMIFRYTSETYRELNVRRIGVATLANVIPSNSVRRLCSRTSQGKPRTMTQTARSEHAPPTP